MEKKNTLKSLHQMDIIIHNFSMISKHHHLPSPYLDYPYLSIPDEEDTIDTFIESLQY